MSWNALFSIADFGEVQVPEAVWFEIKRHRPSVLEQSTTRLICRKSNVSKQIESLSTMFTLHAGEREALSLCLESPGAMLLTDDTAARLAAKTLAVEANGTIGIVIRAIRRNQLDKTSMLDLLAQIPKRTSLHIRPLLLAEIIEEVSAEF